MTDAEIVNGLGKRLAGTTGLPEIVWPNRDGMPELPYVVFDFVPVSAFDETLTGGGTINRGYMVATVVGALNSFQTSALAMSEAIKARFAYGLRITEGTATITITAPPRALSGYRDGANWRAPVRVDYDAI